MGEFAQTEDGFGDRGGNWGVVDAGEIERRAGVVFYPQRSEVLQTGSGGGQKGGVQPGDADAEVGKAHLERAQSQLVGLLPRERRRDNNLGRSSGAQTIQKHSPVGRREAVGAKKRARFVVDHQVVEGEAGGLGLRRKGGELTSVFAQFQRLIADDPR